MYTLGIDIGSASSKAVILKDGTDVVASAVVQVGTGTSGPGRVLEEVFSNVDLTQEDMDYTVATGYGRFSVENADKQLSEITCHAKGIFHLVPSARTIIDIGGQDAKAIQLDAKGNIQKFVMNDKCAAGTGRFLEMTMKRVESEIGRIDTFVKDAKPAKINSMCAVFAESEIVGLLAQDIAPGDIVLGCVESICQRTAAFAQKLAPANPKVFFSGGLAQFDVIKQSLANHLGVKEVATDSLCQYTGAIGAAVLGIRKIKR